MRVLRLSQLQWHSYCPTKSDLAMNKGHLIKCALYKCNLWMITQELTEKKKKNKLNKARKEITKKIYESINLYFKVPEFQSNKSIICGIPSSSMYSIASKFHPVKWQGFCSIQDFLFDYWASWRAQPPPPPKNQDAPEIAQVCFSKSGRPKIHFCNHDGPHPRQHPKAKAFVQWRSISSSTCGTPPPKKKD